MNTQMLFLMLPPVLGSFILGFFSFISYRRVEKISGWIALLAIVISFFAALSMLAGFYGHDTHPVVLDLGSWMKLGAFHLDLVFKVDALSTVFTVLITGVGLLVHLYSIGYMSHDESRTRYFSCLNLFCAFMLVLVTGSSLPIIFVGWEGVGLCSFLLIGFWYTDKANAFAGRKAFVVNRIGDAGFLLGMFLILKTFGSLDISVLEQHSLLSSLAGMPVLEWIMLFLFIGCVGKSAQFPFYIWLPDAMAGPTPVSALIHAATMVTAGIYLLCRMFFMLKLAPMVMDLIAFTGALTAFFAATIAIFQSDIKKVLAYSTVSQLGFMVLAVGAGAPDAGLYHLITHAYFKALLFLAAGSVIHALHGEQNIFNMGGLRTYLPGTAITFICGFVAITGVPPFSGWVTKDAILHAVFSHGHTTLFVLAFLSALMTAGYMTRLFHFVFLGNPRQSVKSAKNIHDSPWVMMLPMWILALLSILGGMGALRFETILEGWSHAQDIKHLDGPVSEMTMNALVTLSTLGAMFTVFYLYNKKYARLESMAQQRQKLISFIQREYGLNQFLVGGATYLSAALSKLFAWLDRSWIDGAVNSVARVSMILAGVISKIQTGHVQGYSYAVVVGFFVLAYYLLSGGV